MLDKLTGGDGRGKYLVAPVDLVGVVDYDADSDGERDSFALDSHGGN